MKKIYVLNFSRYPGPRFEHIGPYSGEKFRDTVLIPEIEANGGEIQVVLDGAYGYGSSFLDESFAGLIRKGIDKNIVLKICENIVSEDDPSLKTEIADWVKEAIAIKESPSNA